MIHYYWGNPFGSTTKITWSDYGFNFYNPETHELVEKKDAKIKRLKDELSSNEDTINAIDEQVLSFSKKKSELITKNNEIKEELKSLE